MWHLLEKISEQVTKYSTFLGQLWYLCVFVFRLIVVATIGGAVYGDEQSAFKCSTQEPGCTNMCFNVFSKISHIRFWAFQLLAVSTPVVFFHFYSMTVTGQIEKLKKDEEAIKAEEGEFELMDDPKMEKDFRKLARRRKSIGNVKVRKVYTGGDLKEIPFTRKIHYAYYVTIVMRLVLEAVFIYLAYGLFKFKDVSTTYNMGPLDFLWFRVPAMYSCTGDSPEVRAACHQATGIKPNYGHVPCWVSRPWEKTIFMRYMNILSGICFLLCAFELIYLTMKGLMGKAEKKNAPRLLRGHSRNHPRQDSVFYATAPNTHHLENETMYPTLAVPIRLGSSEILKYQEANRTREKSSDK